MPTNPSAGDVPDTTVQAGVSESIDSAVRAGGPGPADPALRADAARNRTKILAAARAAFADPEAEVSMAEIARRSGVGSATLYRNFANRRALLEALYADEVDLVCDAADSEPSLDPDERLLTWLRAVLGFFADKRPVAGELLKDLGSVTAFFDTSRARVLAAGEPLLRAAQADGSIVADLSLAQILDLLFAVARIPGDPSYRAPILEQTLTGLRRAPV